MVGALTSWARGRAYRLQARVATNCPVGPHHPSRHARVSPFIGPVLEAKLFDLQLEPLEHRDEEVGQG